MARKGPAPNKAEKSRLTQPDAKSALRVVPDDTAVVALRPPAGILKPSRELWDLYFESDVARAFDPQGDSGLLYRWIRYVDEWHRMMDTLRKTDRVVPGTQGNMVLNPLVAYIDKLERSISKAEKELGMTPLSRASLALEGGEAGLTLQKLNDAVAHASPAGIDSEEDPDIIDIMDEFSE